MNYYQVKRDKKRRFKLKRGICIKIVANFIFFIFLVTPPIIDEFQKTIPTKKEIASFLSFSDLAKTNLSFFEESTIYFQNLNIIIDYAPIDSFTCCCILIMSNCWILPIYIFHGILTTFENPLSLLEAFLSFFGFL